MKRLILFDIDGTLITSPTSSVAVDVIRKRYNIEVSLEGHRIGGMTEPEILSLLLQSSGWDETKIESVVPELMKDLDDLYAQEFQKGSVRLLPGVTELLDALRRPDVVLGLITGNLKSRAQRKLEDVDIWLYFSVGGYGDDPHKTRADLVKTATQRAGFNADDPGVYVIGDTWRDIKAEVDAGVVNRVGLTSPRHPRKEFEEAGATIILSSLANTRHVLQALGI